MNDEDAEIDAEDEPDFNTVLEPEETATAAPRKSVGRSFVFGGFILSTLLGATLGIAGTKLLAGPDETAALRTELEQSLNTLKKSNQTQAKKLGAANNIQKKTKTKLDSLAAENQTLVSQLTALEQQITDLTNTVNVGNMDKAVEDRIAVLEAMSGENADVFKGENSIASRLDGLEKNMEDVQRLSATDTPIDTPNVDVPNGASALSSPVEAVEPTTKTSIDENKIPAIPPVDTEEQSALAILIDTFPRDKMLAAVKAQETSSASKPGWLKRALSKHIKVSNEENIDPYATIDAAEAALKDANITSALEHIAKLNPPVRTSAAEWVQAAKKAANSIEKEN